MQEMQKFQRKMWMSPFILPSPPIFSLEMTTVNNSLNTALSGTALFVFPYDFIIFFLIRIHWATSYFLSTLGYLMHTII